MGFFQKKAIGLFTSKSGVPYKFPSRSPFVGKTLQIVVKSAEHFIIIKVSQVYLISSPAGHHLIKKTLQVVVKSAEH